MCSTLATNSIGIIPHSSRIWPRKSVGGGRFTYTVRFFCYRDYTRTSGVRCAKQRSSTILRAAPEPPATADGRFLTFATCHLTWWDELEVTHDTKERPFHWRVLPVPDRPARAARSRGEMK